MYIAILGRQPAIGMAELEHLYSSEKTKWFSDQSTLVDSPSLSINHLGGTQKAGRVTIDLPRGDWRQASTKIIQTYHHKLTKSASKITLGISAYGFDVSPREVQKTGIILKQKLKHAGVSLRLIPNSEPHLNTATSHHNKLGLSDNKIELIVVRARNGRVIVAQSIGAQNITQLARRDQGRPKRDAFVGMLPPKLAQIMVNLAIPEPKSRSPSTFRDNLQPESDQTSGLLSDPERSPVSEGAGRKGELNQKQTMRILDPFCGTGVILQEAALMGYAVYGTDLSDKMVDYSLANLKWLADSHHLTIDATITQGDAMTTTWQSPIDAVVCESYLGQPFSAPPSLAKLDQVRKNCDHIISEFLKNIASQIESGTPLCIAVPAWRSVDGTFTHLPVIKKLERLGFVQYTFKSIRPDDLLYYREDQVVARELLVLGKL